MKGFRVYGLGCRVSGSVLWASHPKLQVIGVTLNPKP